MQYNRMSNRTAAPFDQAPPSGGCQFITVEKRHYTDADKCSLPPRAGSPYCPVHHAVVFLAVPDEASAVVR